MATEDRSEEQLIKELAEMRHRIVVLEAAETQRKETEETLRESEERFRSLAQTATDAIKQWLRWGGSPRASQHLILAGRARAACQGRFNVACEDVAAVAMPVLRHRLVRTFRAEADGMTTDDIIAQVLNDVPRA